MLPPRSNSLKSSPSSPSRVPHRRVPHPKPRFHQAGPRTLEVVRSRGFEAGARELRSPDGVVQMRLPLGSWILGLRTAEELGWE